ncbi:MAG: regulator, partial [Ruminiclostridium sp.]|nr:regulator [Ruminiclostridium sp.]
MEKIYTKNAPEAVGPYSQAIVHGGLVYTSGQIAINPASGAVEASDIVGQTEQIMKNLGEVLRAAGASFDTAIKTTCFLADMN